MFLNMSLNSILVLEFCHENCMASLLLFTTQGMGVFLNWWLGMKGYIKLLMLLPSAYLQVYLSGFSMEQTEKLRRVLNGGGATRFNEISDCVTHVIVGDIVSSDLKVLKSSGFRYDFLYSCCFIIYVLDSLYLFLLFCLDGMPHYELLFN